MGQFCDDCGAPVGSDGGTFQFYYANRRTNTPSWSPPRTVCGKHKAARVDAGHKAKSPEPDVPHDPESDGE